MSITCPLPAMTLWAASDHPTDCLSCSVLTMTKFFYQLCNSFLWQCTITAYFLQTSTFLCNMAMHELHFHLGMLFQLCEHVTGQCYMRCRLHLHVHVHSPALLACNDYILPIYGPPSSTGCTVILHLFCAIDSSTVTIFHSTYIHRHLRNISLVNMKACLQIYTHLRNVSLINKDVCLYI